MELEPRLLHRTHGYTTNPAAAMRGEPEALDAEELDRLTVRAHRTAREAQLAEWRERRARVEHELQWLELRTRGVEIIPTGSKSSYRTYEQQVELYNAYLNGTGNLAAVPGTSNHGWGLAVDVATQQMRSTIDAIPTPGTTSRRCAALATVAKPSTPSEPASGWGGKLRDHRRGSKCCAARRLPDA